jgi:hypothetical protein
MQQALDVVKDMGANALTEMPDRIYEIWLETGRIAAVSAGRTTENNRLAKSIGSAN